MKPGRTLELYLVALHLVFLAVVAVLLWDRRGWLVAVELFLLLTLLAGARLARRLSEPARAIEESAELVRSQDFTTRLRDVGHPEVRKLVAVYNQMAEHLRAERVRNQEQEGVLSRVVEVSPTGIVFCDPDRRVTAVNPAAARLLGETAASLRGRPLDAVGGAIGRELAALESGTSRLVSAAGRRLLCRKLHFVDCGAPRPFVLIEELTAELDRSERAAYEKLIRMMSHEVHNTSAAVISLLASAESFLGRSDASGRGDIVEALGVATGRTRRLDAFMRRLAEVVRLPPPRRAPCRLPELVAGIERLLRPESTARRISWQVEVDPDFPAISLDAEQMEQVFLNLCRNAIDAIGHDGRVTVRLLCAGAGEPPRAVIEDTGSGIAPAARSQLFTPFFTTKPDGAGVGLTLAREVLHAHGFDFRLDDQPTGGAAFTVHFGR